MRFILLVLPFVGSALAGCQANYCCDGSVIQKNHNGGFGADNYWCCEGDPNDTVYGNTGPTTCTAGTQIPLTQASSEGGSAPTSSAAAEGSSTAAGGSSSTSSGGAGPALITNAPLIGAAVAAGGLLLAV